MDTCVCFVFFFGDKSQDKMCFLRISSQVCAPTYYGHALDDTGFYGVHCVELPVLRLRGGHWSVLDWIREFGLELG